MLGIFTTHLVQAFDVYTYSVSRIRWYLSQCIWVL